MSRDSSAVSRSFGIDPSAHPRAITRPKYPCSSSRRLAIHAVPARYINVVFPHEWLRAMAAAGTIGSVAATHYSFMGAADPRGMEANARSVAGRLKPDRVDAVLLTPV